MKSLCPVVIKVVYVLAIIALALAAFASVDVLKFVAMGLAFFALASLLKMFCCPCVRQG